MIAAFLLLVPGGQTGAQKSADVRAPITEISEKQFAFFPGGKLEISAAAPGSCTIVGWAQAAVRVEMEKVFYYVSAEEARALAKRFPARITYTQTTARVSTAGTDRPGATMEVNMRIFVPKDRTDLSIAMVKGDLSVTALRGSVEARIEEGNIEARDLGGYVSLATERGDLTVAMSPPRWTGYGFWAKTSQGSADIRLPGDFSATLQLGTKNGKISVDYPAQMVEGESVPLPVTEKKNARSISAPIGGGGAPVNVTTLLGDIALKKM